MSRIPVFVGLDYHCESVQVCVLDREGKQLLNRSLANEATAIRAAVEARGVVAGAALEACCGAASLADELALKANWSVALAHPGYVAKLKQSRDKTDFGDARLLADLLRNNYLPRVWLAPEDVRRLRRLVRYRRQLVDQRRDIKLRLRALLRENRLAPSESVGTAWTKSWLAWLAKAVLHVEDRWLADQHLAELKSLTQRIREAEKLLQARLASDPLAQRLLSLPQVGLITAATLRAEIGRFDRFRKGKQLARFCGLSPRNASSGQRQADAGLVRASNPQLRAVLVELAQRLVRTEAHWKNFYYRLKQAGKPHNVIVAAAANRWVRWLYYQMLAPNFSSGSTKGASPLPPLPSPQPSSLKVQG